jgi:hypothetical protein
MEVFLLWMDELDDAVVALWVVLPRLLGLLAAIGALFATAFACLSLPALAAPSLVLLVASLALHDKRRPTLDESLPAG